MVEMFFVLFLKINNWCDWIKIKLRNVLFNVDFIYMNIIYDIVLVIIGLVNVLDLFNFFVCLFFFVGIKFKNICLVLFCNEL